jgi:hypothetical protein
VHLVCLLEQFGMLCALLQALQQVRVAMTICSRISHQDHELLKHKKKFSAYDLVALQQL